MKEKWQRTNEIFDEYEKRFAAARLGKKITRPWEKKDREEILKGVERLLGIREDLIPTISQMEALDTKPFEGYKVITYRYRTFPKVFGAATLYLPDKEEKVPLVFVLCGHGELGRHDYATMGHRLASLGMAAMIADNLGQGDRNFQSAEYKNSDHWTATAPFYCGLTLQGLIVMEMIALVRFMEKDERFDPKRIAACGNSGGGTLGMFLQAFVPTLSALSSSGYPSDFAEILQKERKHCSCNLLRGAAFGPDMWEIYSLFAPKPLLLEGGRFDHLVPQDHFLRNYRKVKNTYIQLSAEENIEKELTPTRHSWEMEDINRISRFLSERLLGITPKDGEEMIEEDDPFTVPMPEEMIGTDRLAENLTGKKMPDGTQLWDVFPPMYQGEKILFDTIETNVGRGDVRSVFAQYECTLKK